MSQPIRGQGGHLVFPIGPKNTNLVEGIEILLPLKFRWILFSGFREEVENVKVYGRRRMTTTTDGRTTDDGRCAMTIAHLSLRLRWAKKCKAHDAVNRPFSGIYLQHPKYYYSHYLSFNFWPIYYNKCLKFSLMLLLLRALLLTLLTTCKCTSGLSDSRIPEVLLTCYTLKLSSTKIKQFLGLFLNLQICLILTYIMFFQSYW